MKKLRHAPSRRELEAICNQQEGIVKPQAAIIAHLMSARNEDLTLSKDQLQAAPNERLAFVIDREKQEVAVKLLPAEPESDLPAESLIVLPDSPVAQRPLIIVP